jgi:hypothetical protein
MLHRNDAAKWCCPTKKRPGGRFVRRVSGDQ